MRKMQGVSVSECPEGKKVALWNENVSTEGVDVFRGESQHWRNWSESLESPLLANGVGEKNHLCPRQESDFGMKKSIENN